jgi:hypothetical protein
MPISPPSSGFWNVYPVRAADEGLVVLHAEPVGREEAAGLQVRAPRQEAVEEPERFAGVGARS